MKLNLIDFKSHKKLSVDLIGNTKITGKNGEGKTSILEAIVFALYGRNFYGKLGTDAFVREGSLGATVTLEMSGTEIKRTQGKENNVYLNGKESKVAEIGSLFPSADLALAVLNPLAFIYEIGELEKRELFMKTLPQPDKEKIFLEHFGNRKDLLDRFKSYTLKGIRDEIRNFATTIKANQLQIESYQLDIQTLEARIKQIRDTFPATPQGVLQGEIEVQKELEDIEAKLNVSGDPRVRVNEYKAELKEYSDGLKPTLEKLKVQTLSEAIAKLQAGVEKLKEMATSEANLVSEQEMLIKQLEQFKLGYCPVCKQAVTNSEVHLKEAKEKLEVASKNLDDYSQKHTKYSDILKRLLSTQEAVTRCKNGIATHEAKIDNYDKLKARVVELKEKLKGNSQQDFKDAVELERKREEVKLIQGDIMRKKGTIARLQESITKMDNDLPDLEVIEKALSNKGVDSYIAKEQAEMIEELIKPYMELNITTVLENKTNDNLRETFEVSKDGVSWRSMSFGERIKASIAFGLVLRKLHKGFNLPFVLLDEASVLSSGTLNEIKDWLKKEGVSLIYTQASETKLTIESDEKE